VIWFGPLTMLMRHWDPALDLMVGAAHCSFTSVRPCTAVGPIRWRINGGAACT
jgi:hypothetical protein